MEQLEQDRAPGPTGWHILAADSKTVIPIHPGMKIGETESGKLSFDRAHAQLELDIESDSLLVVRALGNIQLTSSEGTGGETDCVKCRRSVAISLSQNTLRLNTEFVGFAPSRRALQFSVVYPPSDEVVTEAPAESIEPVTQSEVVMPPSQRAGMTSGSLPESTRSDLPDYHRPVSQTELRSSSRGMLDRLEMLATNFLAGSLITRKALGVLAVAIFSLVLGVLAFYSSTSTRPPDETDVALQTADSEVSEPSTAEPAQPSDKRPNPRMPSVSTVTTPIETLNESSDVAPDAGEIFRPTDEIQRTVTARPEGFQEALDDLAVTTPPQEVVVRETNQLDELPSAPAERINAPQAASVRTVESLQIDHRRATESAVKRDLLAADVALAEGRLMLPEDTSALALYRRVLSQDPDSPDALRGIASVREQLINRAFAQLAAGKWNLVPVTLDAAEKAGASGDLVVDLRIEANYQVRLARARAGQFDDLYPSHQLDAIAQKRPRLSRWRTGGYRQVEVEFTVTMRGDVRDVQVLGNPPPRLADTIGRAVETWRFEPVLENGRPLPVRTRVLIEVGS